MLEGLGLTCSVQEFGSAYPVSEEEAKSLPDNRWAPLTLQHMREAGGQRFAFLTPLEKLASRRVSANSGFLFEILSQGETSYLFFPVISSFS